MRTADHQLPGYVEQELRAYLRCGILYVQLCAVGDYVQLVDFLL